MLQHPTTAKSNLLIHFCRWQKHHSLFHFMELDTARKLCNLGRIFFKLYVLSLSQLLKFQTYMVIQLTNSTSLHGLQLYKIWFQDSSSWTWCSDRNQSCGTWWVEICLLITDKSTHVYIIIWLYYPTAVNTVQIHTVSAQKYSDIKQ